MKLPTLDSAAYPTPAGMGRTKVGPLELVVRSDTIDEGVVQEVIKADYYKLKAIQLRNLPVRRVLDVGAHIGAFSRYVKHLWPDAVVYAFEADPANIALLGRNCGFAQTGLKIINAALWKEELPELEFLSAVGSGFKNTGGGSVKEADACTLEARPDTIKVPAFRASEVVRDLCFPDLPLDILKLDCEGSEYAILEELHEAALLSRIVNITGEYHKSLTDMENLLQILADTHQVVYQRAEEVDYLGCFRATLKTDILKEKAYYANP